MKKTRFTIAALAMAVLWLPSGVWAQQTNPAQPSTAQQGTPDNPNQLGRPPAGTPTEQYEARRATTSQGSQGQGPTVTQAIVQKLHKANQAEIELAKMAMEKTDNPQVKQLAQTIVQDHQACNQKLQQKMGQSQASQVRQAGQDVGGGQQPRAGQQQPTLQNQASQAGDRQRLGSQQPALDPAQSQTPTVPPQLTEIAEQACDNSLKMTKDMLSNYQGQDFDMAFLGQQIVAHTMMLAELKAIESTGPQELQQVAQEAGRKVEQHLETTKQLAKKLEDDRKQKQS